MRGEDPRERRIADLCDYYLKTITSYSSEPHALSVLKARTELYARRVVFLSHMVCSYQLLLNCPTRRGNRDLPFPPLYPSRFIFSRTRRDALYIFFSFSSTMMRDLNCYSNSTSTQSRGISVPRLFRCANSTRSDIMPRLFLGRASRARARVMELNLSFFLFFFFPENFLRRKK